MKVYRIIHNIHAYLKLGENETQRYFSDLRYANEYFELLAEKIDYSNDEWISLDDVEVICPIGEYMSGKEIILRYLSDDTKIGVKFDVDEYIKNNVL